MMKLFFEVYPPKTKAGMDKLYDSLDKLMDLKPDCISVTQNPTNIERQCMILDYLHNCGQASMANLTCIDKSKEDINKLVKRYEELGVSRILALRGDLPKGKTGTGGDFQHADELIAYIRELTEVPIGAACYPEGHIEDKTPVDEFMTREEKRKKGASFFVSQMCYHPFIVGQDMYDDIFVGIMPVLVRERVTEMALKNGVSIPSELAQLIGRYWDEPEAFKEAGKEYTVKLINSLMFRGVDKFQIFTMNRADDVIEIVRRAGLR